MTTVDDDVIRAFLADEGRRAVAAAPSFDEAIGQLAPRVGGRPAGPSRRLLVLLAATLLLTAAVGSAIAIGSGLIRLPTFVDDPGIVGEWASTDYSDIAGASAAIQKLTIRAQDDGFHIALRDDSSILCSDTPLTMTGGGQLDDSTTLVVPAPILACVDGSEPANPSPDSALWLEAASSSYTLVYDMATDRLYDNREVVWTRGAGPEAWAGESTARRSLASGDYSILHGEVTIRAAAPWDDHAESYIDPRVFFMLGPGGDPAAGTPQEPEAGIAFFVNPIPPEAPCDDAITTLVNPLIPPSAEELVQAIRSNPNLETTDPVSERVGEIDAQRMDVVAVPGAAIGPCGAVDVDVVYVRGRPWGGVETDGFGRVYLLDLPGGSARTLAILITAPNADLFQQALRAAAPVLDSFEFHSP